MQTSPPTNRAPDWTIQRLLQWTTSYFKSHDIDSPRASAEILLAHTLNLERIDLYLRFEQPLIQAELQRYKSMIKRRVRREPVAYIVGTKEFWSMELHVAPEVLIPRPETECLVEAVRERLQLNPESGRLRVLELGTGSGAVILALASERPGHDFFATDRSMGALGLARRNARRHRLGNAVRFVCGDWFGPFRNSGARFDVILSNPPYIAKGDLPGLQPEIFRYEPLGALDGGVDGLGPLRLIITEAAAYLKPEGHLFLEIGYDQGAAVADICSRTGVYGSVSVTKDYSGQPRIARLKKINRD